MSKLQCVLFSVASDWRSGLSLELFGQCRQAKNVPSSFPVQLVHSQRLHVAASCSSFIAASCLAYASRQAGGATEKKGLVMAMSKEVKA